MSIENGTTHPVPRLLFIDAYDSFSNNIISLLKTELSANVTTIRIDDSRFSNDIHDTIFQAFLSSFDAVVIGPGPGDPQRPEDVGVIVKLWRLPDHLQIPVLGICLGFQALVLAFGGTVARLKQPRHGLVKSVTHNGRSLFANISEVKATQYHSWRAELGHTNVNADDTTLWACTTQAPLLLPLAWDLSDLQNGPILMATKHLEKPLWGVQYHPESICTNEAGAQIVRNWWNEARFWSSQRNKGLYASIRAGARPSPDHLDSGYATEDNSRSPSPYLGPMALHDGFTTGKRRQRISWTTVENPESVDLIPELMKALESATGHVPIILESGTKAGRPVRAETGRFSILCLVESEREIFEYWSDTGILDIKHGNQQKDSHKCDATQCFDHLKSWRDEHSAVDGPPHVPFWGGLVGFVSYEASLETISVPLRDSSALGPDICFVSVRRSIVIDHVAKEVYIQTVEENGNSFLEQMKDTTERVIAESLADGHADHTEKVAESTWKCTIQRPARDEYCNKVGQCQLYIAAGDSYELCLTDRSSIVFDQSAAEPTPLQLYHRLRRTNPAPFAAFLNLGADMSIISSSPERFLSWNRDGLCEFRPIKGTVQKSPGMTRASAEAILKTDKEQAENLMIVDLIRHDLNGVVGLRGGAATVPKLMQIEEYETVYQLVSVIRGQLNSKATSGTTPGETTREKPVPQQGIDVLRASLPPGSMTGAPKKRSCELLGKIEGRRRGAYSGVLGYLDVGGGGDFSVVIRSVIKDRQGYSISAGGAVTSLSDPLSEWEEMMAKSTAVKI